VPKSVGGKGDFGHLRSQEQHTNGYIWLARYNFLLVNLRSRWNCWRVKH